MPPATPSISLKVTLYDYSGNKIGSSDAPAWVRIALCGFGPELPTIPGTGNIAKVSSWFVDVPVTGATVTIPLWGQEQIYPLDQTYYTIALLDEQKNVLESGNYIFNGPATIDLSQASQILPGQAAGIPNLEYAPCTGAVPGTSYTAPGPVVAVALNGVLLPRGIALPTLSYSLAGPAGINLNFTTSSGDRIDALCIVQ